MIIKEKYIGEVKGQQCTDRHEQWDNIVKIEMASPTVCLDLTFITSFIDANKAQDVTIVNLSCAFLSIDNLS